MSVRRYDLLDMRRELAKRHARRRAGEGGFIGGGVTLGSRAHGGFNIAARTGKFLWLRADLGITTVSGLVSAWADQSGVGDANRNLTQATSTSRFDFVAADAAYNNKPSLKVTTNVAGAWMAATGNWASPPSSPFTLYWAGTPTGSRYLLGGDTASQYVLIHGNGAAWLIESTSNSLAAGGAIASPSVCCAVYNGASSAFYYQDSQTAAASGTLGTGGFTRLNLGSYTTSGTPPASTNWALGSVAEVVGFSGADSAAQRRQMMLYLGARYALTAS
jgi:hypothetical protein